MFKSLASVKFKPLPWLISNSTSTVSASVSGSGITGKGIRLRDKLALTHAVLLLIDVTNNSSVTSSLMSPNRLLTSVLVQYAPGVGVGVGSSDEVVSCDGVSSDTGSSLDTISSSIIGSSSDMKKSLSL